MKCPRCDTELDRTNIRELGLTYNAHQCPTCKGYWVGAEQLTDIELQVDRKLLEFRRIPSPSRQLDVLQCPQCPGMVQMAKVESSRDRKVIMDTCPECKNIWLDGGEITAIQQESLPMLLLDCLRWSRQDPANDKQTQ